MCPTPVAGSGCWRPCSTPSRPRAAAPRSTRWSTGSRGSRSHTCGAGGHAACRRVSRIALSCAAQGRGAVTSAVVRINRQGSGASMARRVSACLGLVSWVSLAGAAPPPWVFVTEPFPPYTYAEKGRAAGPLADVLREVCATLKRECRLELRPWRGALGMAERGEADGIFAFADATGRRELFHISVPVLDARYSFFSRAGEAYVYRNPASLAGRTVGVYGPSGASLLLDELRRGQEVEVVMEGDNPTVP